MRQMAARRQAVLEAMKKEGMAAVVKDRFGRMFSPGFLEKNPATAERYQSILLQNNPEGYIKVMQRMGRLPTAADLSKITCPTLIIGGEHDPSSGPVAVKATQEAIPGSKLKIFPTGHPPFLEQPPEYNETVLRFLAEVGLS